MTTYSFEIDFKKFVRVSPTLQDVGAIYVSGICIMAKNGKYGKFYYSKYIKKVHGKFAYGAGSNSYPILYPTKDTKILVHNFPKKPIIELGNLAEYKSEFLNIPTESIVEIN